VEGNIGAQAICDENGANCVDVSTITANVLENPVVGFFSHAVIFSMDYSGAGTYEATLTASHDFCSGGYYLGVIKKDGSRQLISTPFGGDCTTVSLDSTNTEPAKYLVWNHADDRFYWRINSASITADEQVVGYYYYGTNKFQWLVKTNPFRFPQTNHLNMGGNNIALNGGYLSGDGGDEGIAVDSDGNVGIGTTNPGAKLQIMDDGDATIKLSRLNGDQYLTLTGGNGGTQMIKSAYDLELSTHASDKDILLMPTGNVGIGTTNPSKTLEVKGEINVSNSEVSMYMDGGALIIEG